MGRQLLERVVAHPGNAASTSLSIPDRERAGTAHVRMRVGQMPGPQRQVSSDFMPGVAPMPMLPAPPQQAPDALAGGAAGMLPGMGSMLPGMGDVTVSTGTLAALAAVAIGGFIAWKKWAR